MEKNNETIEKVDQLRGSIVETQQQLDKALTTIDSELAKDPSNEMLKTFLGTVADAMKACLLSRRTLTENFDEEAYKEIEIDKIETAITNLENGINASLHRDGPRM